MRNSFDVLVENMTANFSKIENFDLVRTDEKAKKLFNMTVFRAAELSSYRNLIYHHFIPATNKAIVESKQTVLTSRYRLLIDIKMMDFQETLYDTIRLYYVGLFHKIENFVTEIGTMADMVFFDPNHEPIFTWIKKNFDFDFKDWQRFPIFFRINWICNCVKHKDGYPVKLPKPAEFAQLDPSVRIRISAQDFKNDCDRVIEFYPVFMRYVMNFSLARGGLQGLFSVDDGQDAEFTRRNNETKDKLFDLMRKMIENIERAEIAE